MVPSPLSPGASTDQVGVGMNSVSRPERAVTTSGRQRDLGMA